MVNGRDGNEELKADIWLAPLHGITTYTFRNCLCRHFGGVDLMLAPFLPAQEKTRLKVRNWRDLWPENNSLKPVVPQLMGNVPEQVADTMALLHETYGYCRFNWNLGCPASPVVRHQRGCGLMPCPDRVAEVLEKASSVPGLHLSVKMRLGLHEKSESEEIVTVMNQYPLDFVVIHPRTGDQLYDGLLDWNCLEKLASRLKHTLFYSGDIFSAADYRRMTSRFPFVKGCLLGRGLLRNPFLAEEIRGMDTGDRMQRFYNYYRDLTESLLPLRKESGTLANLKELWHYYVHLVHLSEDELRALLRITDFSEFAGLTSELILDERRWKPLP